MSVLDCPISSDKVDERIVRAVAFQVFVLSLTQVFFPHWIVPLFLIYDFVVRATNNRRYSVLRLIGKQLKFLWGKNEKAIDFAPKKFAASLGFSMSVLWIICSLNGYYILSTIIACIFIVLSTLEWAFSVCVGCYLYGLLSIYKSGNFNK